jgi:hypothetical protein
VLTGEAELGAGPVDLAAARGDGGAADDLDCGSKPCLPGPLLGTSLRASGTWTGSDVFSYSCVPGTPGRDENGCCSGSSAIGGRPSTLDFQIAPAMDGTLELRILSYTIDGFGGSHPTMQAGSRIPDGSFQIQPFRLSGTFAYSIEGLLSASWLAPRFSLRYSGSGTGHAGSGGCSEETINIQATWELEPGK